MSSSMCHTCLKLWLTICNVKLNLNPFRNAPVPFLMGIEERMLKDAEENINDGTYIIDIDEDRVRDLSIY